MYQSNWSFNIFPWAKPGHLTVHRARGGGIWTLPWKGGEFEADLSLVLAKWEIYHNDTFKLLLKTLLRESFNNKGEILSWKSVKPCKNWKNSWAYYARTIPAVFFWPIFFVEFLVELDVTSTGCVALRSVAFCCLLRIALCSVVLWCDGLWSVSYLLL